VHRVASQEFIQLKIVDREFMESPLNKGFHALCALFRCL
jgi:hypothetical protein